MLCLGFVLKLPWDIGVPSGLVVPSWSVGEGAKLPSDAVRTAIGVGVPPSSGHSLVGWAEFDTVSVPVQLPLAASDLAFGPLRPDISGRRALRRLKRRVRKHAAARASERRTVAFVNVTTERIGDALEDAQAFFRAFDLLNAWLVSLGVSHDARLRPLTVGDLPEEVPYMPTVWHVDGSYERGTAAPMRLRESQTHVRTYDASELDRAMTMFDVVTSRAGLAIFYELVQRAGAARSSHRYREAVTDYATAGELFITEMYRDVAPRRGVAEEKIAHVVNGGFADRARHLSRLLGHAEEPTDENSVVFFWWLHCYLQRNRIVHEGAVTIAPLVELARVGLVTMVVDIREALRADPELADIAPRIQWAYRVDETGQGKDSWPDGDPRAQPT